MDVMFALPDFRINDKRGSDISIHVRLKSGLLWNRKDYFKANIADVLYRKMHGNCTRAAMTK